LVLIVEVLKEKGFGKRVRRRGLEEGFREGEESYKVIRY
jgi:hypothetical protein